MGDVRTLILTRPRRQSEDFAAAVEARFPGRFAPVVAPLIDIEPVPAALDLAGVQGLAFTSANGVEQFAAVCPDRTLTAFCVGDVTAEAARAAGFRAESATGDVAALADLLVRSYRPGAGAFLHVRGRHAAGDLAGRLEKAGVPARAAEIYDQVERPLAGPAEAALAAGEEAVVLLFSPRTARLFAGEARASGWQLGRATVVSLSAAADEALGDLAAERRMRAETPDREGMLAALGRL
jgi:uroporphyrinogen-III synthase